MFAYFDKFIEFWRKYWWAAVLLALVCLSAALLYYTLWPPETPLEKQIRLRASFLEPKQAKDLSEARDLLDTVNRELRQLPRDVMLWRQIVMLQGQIGSGEFTEEAKQQLEQKAQMRWEDLQNSWLGETAAILGLSEDERPKDLKEALQKLSMAKKRIEKENNEGFNKTLKELLADLENNRSKSGLLDAVNKFLAEDVADMASERLTTMGAPALPTLTKLLEEEPSGLKATRIYEVIITIIAETRLSSLNPADLENAEKSVKAEFGGQPDAAAIKKIKAWMNSPGNRELFGEQA